MRTLSSVLRATVQRCSGVLGAGTRGWGGDHRGGLWRCVPVPPVSDLGKRCAGVRRELRPRYISAGGDSYDLLQQQEVIAVTERAANLPEPRRKGHGGPARGYAWEPFERGNAAAETHGGYSERRVAPLAARARSELLSAAPWVASPAFEAAVAAWSRVEGQTRLVAAYVAEKGPLDQGGKPRPAVDLLVRLERLAADLRGRLGLDPSSRARIERDLAAGVRDLDLSDTLAEGRRVRLAAEERGR
jgi:hypothetical protein